MAPITTSTLPRPLAQLGKASGLFQGPPLSSAAFLARTQCRGPTLFYYDSILEFTQSQNYLIVRFLSLGVVFVREIPFS